MLNFFKEISVAFIVALLLITSASAFAQDRNDKELRAHIDTQNIKFMAAFNSANAEAATALYTKDAKFMPPNLPKVIGLEEILAAFKTELGGPANLSLTLSTVDYEHHGDIVYESHTWVMNVTLPDNSKIIDTGDAVVIWKKGPAGDWLMYADIFNSNTPLEQ